MMKLLFVPTGNVFTLPDEEALRIKATDRGNYRILDAGYQEEGEEVVPPKTVKELVMKQDEESKKQELQDNPSPKEKIELPKYEDMKRNELLAVCKKLGIPTITDDNKAKLLEKINKKLGK